MKYPLFLFIQVSTFFVTAQPQNDTTWKKNEKDSVIFYIRPKPPAPVRNLSITQPQGLSLNDIFNQYQITLKTSKNDPKNLQTLLNYPIVKCCVGYAVNNIVRDYDNDWEWGVFQIRNLYVKQPVIFEKITVRAPNGTLYFIRKVCTVKTG